MTARPVRRVRTILGGSLLPILGLTLLASGAARADESRSGYAAWQGCVERNFSVQARLTSRTLAADVALTACRPSENAYLAALARSPLLADAEAADARPALIRRIRDRLLDRRAAL